VLYVWAQRKPETLSASCPAKFILLVRSGALPCVDACRPVFHSFSACQRGSGSERDSTREPSRLSQIVSCGRASVRWQGCVSCMGRRGGRETFSRFFSHARHCQVKKSCAARLLAWLMLCLTSRMSLVRTRHRAFAKDRLGLGNRLKAASALALDVPARGWVQHGHASDRGRSSPIVTHACSQ
jgi:hypothetical protein